MMAGAGLILTWLNRKKFVCCAPEEKVASLGKKKAAVMIGNLTVWRILDRNHDLAVATVKCLQEK